MRIPRPRPGFLAAPAFAVLLAACGGGSETATSSAADGAASSEPSVQDIGEANLDLLQPADDARDVQILSVADGSITSLREAVDGDRPVLLWFWSPH